MIAGTGLEDANVFGYTSRVDQNYLEAKSRAEPRSEPP